MASVSLCSSLRVDSESAFFSVIHSRRFVLALLADSSSTDSKGLSEAFELASESPDLRGVVFVRAELSSAPGLARHYELDSSAPIGLFLFVRNQLERFDPSEPEIFAKIKTRLSRLGREGGASELEEAAKTSGVGFVLLGRGDSKGTFRRVEEANLSLTFLRVPKLSEARRVYRLMLGAEKPPGPLLCVYRKDPASPLDPAFECRELGGLASTMKFVQFEQFPRLRTPEMHADILKYMFWRKEVLMFLSAGEDPAQVEEFQKAIGVLPKNMIYAITSSSQPEPTFIQIFMLAKTVQAPSTVYIAFAVAGSEVRLISMAPPITARGVVAFAEDFRKKNRWMFEDNDAEALRELVGEGPEDSADLEEPERAEGEEDPEDFADSNSKGSDDGLKSHEGLSEEL